MVEIKTPGEVDAVRAAGKIVAEALSAVREHAKPGTRLSELDEVARSVLAQERATSPFLGYQPGFAPVPFPAVICASVNDAALHGIPGRRKLADGDLLSIDFAAVLDGRIGDISAAIGSVGRAGGYGISTDFGGHGVGRSMHEAPSVPNEGKAGRGMRLSPGLVIAIEPWFLAGGEDRYVVDRDGWTIRSADGSRAVHVEHTIAVTPDGPQILTAA